MIKKIVATALALTLAAPAMAWGDREQGILTGIGALLLLQNLNRQNAPVVVDAPIPPGHRHPAPPIRSSHPIIYPDYTVCNDIWDWRMRESCYRGAEARARQEHNRMMREAYQRGYQGQ